MLIQSESLPGLMNDTAFRAFYEQTAAGLHAYLSRSLDRASAEDLLQESFIRYLRSAPPDLGPANRKAYLYRIASRNRKELFRVRTAQPSIELRSDVARIFERLDPRRRALLWLAYVEGFDHGEIAEALGISKGSVLVLLFRARSRMATLLTEAGFGSGAGRSGRDQLPESRGRSQHDPGADPADDQG